MLLIIHTEVENDINLSDNEMVQKPLGENQLVESRLDVEQLLTDGL
jgi:hypothetical protein